MTKKAIVSILGCGWFGIPLAVELLAAGYTVRGSTTSADKLSTLGEKGIEPFLIDIRDEEVIGDLRFFNCDILIISIPPLLSGIDAGTYRNRFNILLSEIKDKPYTTVVFISSIGIYGNPNREVTEQDLPAPDTASSEALLVAENGLKAALSCPVTILRFAGLIGPGRHPGRFLAGKSELDNGKAPVNLVHLDDCTGLTLKIIALQAFGKTYNICSPQHPAREDYYVEAAEKGGFAPPTFNQSLSKWKIVSSIYIPSVLHWEYKDIQITLPSE